MTTTTCAHCGEARMVLLEIEPGRFGDRKPWHLCGKCYLEGIVPWNDKPAEKAEKARPKKGEPAGKSLVTGDAYFYTGETIDLRPV